MERLARIEALHNKSSRIRKYRFGLPSAVAPRPQPPGYPGFTENLSVAAMDVPYNDSETSVCWSSALLPYFVGLYNVEPSQEFIDFVMTFPLEEEEYRYQLEQQLAKSEQPRVYGGLPAPPQRGAGALPQAAPRADMLRLPPRR
ncbi:Hypothetical protein POVN_LOCUS544 [uncultured virus]|nr:Hypothetical protein POVN_LOCUS544 [uncultured virus]